jgi:hypothetical protein
MSLYWNTKNKQNQNGILILRNSDWKKLIKRFFILFIGATVINIFNIQYSELNLTNTSIQQILLGLSDELSYSDVFHLVAVGTILIPFLNSFIPVKYLWLISVLFCVVQQPLIIIISSVVEYEHIDSNFISFLYNLLIGNYNGDSYYPIFPWMSLFSLGFYCGFLEDYSKKYIKYCLLILAILLILFFIPGNNAIILNPENVWGAQIYVPKFTDYLGLCGAILIQYLLIFSLSDKLKKVLGSNISPLRVYSKAILFAFVFHSVVFYQILSLFTEKINNSALYFFLVQIAQFLLIYVSSYLWLKWRRKNNVDI